MFFVEIEMAFRKKEINLQDRFDNRELPHPGSRHSFQRPCVGILHWVLPIHPWAEIVDEKKINIRSIMEGIA